MLRPSCNLCETLLPYFVIWTKGKPPANRKAFIRAYSPGKIVSAFRREPRVVEKHIPRFQRVAKSSVYIAVCGGVGPFRCIPGSIHTEDAAHVRIIASIRTGGSYSEGHREETWKREKRWRKGKAEQRQIRDAVHEVVRASSYPVRGIVFEDRAICCRDMLRRTPIMARACNIPVNCLVARFRLYFPEFLPSPPSSTSA